MRRGSEMRPSVEEYDFAKAKSLRVVWLSRPDDLAVRSERGVSQARAVPSCTDRHWNNIDLFVYRDASDLEIDCEDDATHTLIYSLAEASAMSDMRAAGRRESELGEGHTIVSPAGARLSIRGSAAWLAVIRFGVPFLAHVAAGIGYSEGAPLGERTVWKPYDRFLDGCIRLIIAEMDTPGDLAQASMMEHLGAVVATHLIRLCGSRIVSTRSRVYVGRWKYLASVTEYIDHNMSMKISLQDLSKVAAMSPFHFSRLFKRATGLTPMAYLEGRRIDRAKLLIREGAMSLSEVAHEVGFSDQSHFTRRFRRQTGMTPTTYGCDASLERGLHFSNIGA
jgi:AraC family transcriptional regulator